MKKLGHIIDGKFIHYKRSGLHEFLERLFASFDVAIWTCAKRDKALKIFRAIFTEGEQAQFKYLILQDSCLDVGINNPHKNNGKAPILLKNMMDFIRNKSLPYDSRHILLIDDSPYKTFVNYPKTSLFAPSFSYLNEGFVDDFLLALLWPVLEKLKTARDVRLFLKYNEPRWSSTKVLAEVKSMPRLYDILDRYCGERVKLVSTPPKFPYTVLEVFEYELSWIIKSHAANLPTPVNLIP